MTGVSLDSPPLCDCPCYLDLRAVNKKYTDINTNDLSSIPKSIIEHVTITIYDIHPSKFIPLLKQKLHLNQTCRALQHHLNQACSTLAKFLKQNNFHLIFFGVQKQVIILFLELNK